jgi:hypothetical protein
MLVDGTLRGSCIIANRHGRPLAKATSKNNPDAGTAEALGLPFAPCCQSQDYRWLYPVVVSIFGFDIPIGMNQAPSPCVGQLVMAPPSVMASSGPSFWLNGGSGRLDAP